MARDPVCGMEVKEEKICAAYQGKKYCFCSKACKKSFEKEPDRYLRDKS